MTFIVKIFWNESERRIRALWRLVLQIVLLFIVLLVLKYVILSLTTLVGLATQSITLGQINYDAITGLFLEFSENHYDVPLLAQEFVSTLISVWLAGRLLDRRRFASFGFRLNKNWWIDFGFGLFLGGFLISLVFLIELTAGWIKITGVFVTDNPASPFAIAILYPAVTMLLVGIQEELIFRGYQLTNLAEGLHWKRMGPHGAVISAMLLSAIAFALLHANNPHASATSTFSAFMGGIITALGFVLTGELAISIGLHITWNFFQANVFGFTVSGMEFSWATILATEQSGPALWVGDAFGPESGLLTIGAVVLGCLLILLWVRLRCGRVGIHTSIATTSVKETFMMKKSRSLFVLALIIILFILWLGSSSCTTLQPAATELPQVGEQTTNTPLQPTATPALANTPPPDGRSGVIAFTSAQDGNMEIYIMDVDGGDPQRLTNHLGEDYWPTWSPDGAQIAFASERDGDFEIYAMNADGSNLRRLTHETGNDLEPAWSSDGDQIAFMVHQAGKSDVYIMNADGSERRRLTDSNGDNYLPKWSPNGAQIVFVSEQDGNPEIYVMNADGGDQRRLTDNLGDDLYPSWSPDGAQITFYSEREGGRELYVMDVNGRNPHPLTHDNASVWVSDWSPDGNRIAFTSHRDGNREIYIMDVDGSNLQRLTKNNVLDGIPVWSPIAEATIIPVGRVYTSTPIFGPKIGRNYSVRP